jgi:hypothetical protein
LIPARPYDSSNTFRTGLYTDGAEVHGRAVAIYIEPALKVANVVLLLLGYHRSMFPIMHPENIGDSIDRKIISALLSVYAQTRPDV